MNKTMQNTITYGILTSKEVCEILDSEWGLNMMKVGFGQMMKGEDKLTPKQHREKHGYEGSLF